MVFAAKFAWFQNHVKEMFINWADFDSILEKAAFGPDHFECMTVVAIGLAGREKALEGPGTIKDYDFWLNVFQEHAKANGKFCVPVIGGVAGPKGRDEVFGRKAHAFNKLKGRSKSKKCTVRLFL